MQPFFVSEEKLARQAYRYDGRYRLAAFLLIVAILLQVPFLGSALLSKSDQRRGRKPAWIGASETGPDHRRTRRLERNRSSAWTDQILGTDFTWQDARERRARRNRADDSSRCCPIENCAGSGKLSTGSLWVPALFGCRRPTRSPWKESRKVRILAVWEKFVRRFPVEASPRQQCRDQLRRRRRKFEERDPDLQGGARKRKPMATIFRSGVNKIDAEENL